MVSGLCVAPWWPYADAAVLCAAAAFAAATIVIACTLTAPSHRRVVAPIVLAAGSVLAVALAIAADTYLPLPAAILAGGLATRWLRRVPLYWKGPAKAGHHERLEPDTTSG
jgi:hypothetical protein